MKLADHLLPTLHDAHCHVLLREEDVHPAQRGWCVLNATGVADWEETATTARDHPSHVIPSFGVHPWFVAQQPTDWLIQLERWLEHFPQAAVGEIGLDYARQHLSRNLQHSFFQSQLELAHRLGRPASIHCVRAWDTLADILKSCPSLPSGILLHSFNGTASLVEPFLAVGTYFGFHAQRSTATHDRNLFTRIPPERILIETDHLHDRVSSISLPETYNCLADILGCQVVDLAAQIHINFHNLFASCLTHTNLAYNPLAP